METKPIILLKTIPYRYFNNYKTERDAVSSNGIFDKTIPGLSATQREILVHRYSIIIELNIPVITDKEIETYLASMKIQKKKILLTPESYMKLKPIARRLKYKSS